MISREGAKTLRRILWTLLIAVNALYAALGPENVAVVVNEDSWASLAVANEYVLLRHIPANNVIYLQALPNFETIDIETFREKILKPVFQTIELRGLAQQIDCIAYSSDIPYAVDTSGDKLPAPLPKIFTRTASITSLTFLYQRVLAKDTSYLDLNANRYMRRVKGMNDSPLSETERKQYFEVMKLSSGEKKPAEALPLLEELAKSHPKNYEVLYNLACCQARLKKIDEAIVSLRAAAEAGWHDIYHTREDSDFAEIRERSDFKEILKKIEGQTIQTLAPHGFKSSYAWDAKGEIDPAGKGERYMLSTMLAVTSGRGTSVSEALKNLKASAEADGSMPGGTIYYMLNGDIRSKTRRWGFQAAVDQLQKLGVKAAIEEGVLPKNKSSVMGLMAGSADFDWKTSGSQILPGAICEHLTSCGGELAQHRGQTCCTQFLRFGAAGTSGAVQEPFALQQKFPTPFIHVYYAQGYTLAEAFYLSVSGPYQLVVIGDPLCAPWKKRNGESKDVDAVKLRPMPHVESFDAVTKENAELVKGLRVTFDDGSIKVIDPSHDAQWLKNAGLAKGHTCTVDAWLDAADEDVYQFQLKTPMKVSIEINGKALPVTETNGWQFLPMGLKKCAHHVVIKVDSSSAEPIIDLRFGGAGTRSIEGEMFRCVKK